MKWRETHYALICEVLREQVEERRNIAVSYDTERTPMRLGILDILAASFADALEGSNERFDRERFLRECGVKS